MSIGDFVGDKVPVTQYEVKERGIQFSTDMVKAILEGRKTQTRRVIKPQPLAGQAIYSMPSDTLWAVVEMADKPVDLIRHIKCPYGQVGDRLWVRETLRRKRNYPNMPDYITYPATLTGVSNPNPEEKYITPLGTLPHRPTWIWQKDVLNAMFMPRWASRIDLEITNLRAERLQGITEEDAEAEGFKYHIDEFQPGCSYIVTAREKFEDKWDSINAERGYGWEANPWVWVIGFKVCNK